MRQRFPEFCQKVNGYLKVKITPKDVGATYANLLFVIDSYIEEMHLEQKITVNFETLKEAVIDFYVDTARIQSFHAIDGLSVKKDNAYKAYWLLRRKAIQILKPYDDCEFVNERFVASFLLAVIKKENNITDNERNNRAWQEFCDLLYRTLQFRTVSSQCFELMIEALFCGCKIGEKRGSAKKIAAKQNTG